LHGLLQALRRVIIGENRVIIGIADVNAKGDGFMLILGFGSGVSTGGLALLGRFLGFAGCVIAWFVVGR